MSSKIFLRDKYKKIRTEIKDKEVKSDIIKQKVINLPKYIKANKIALYYSMDFEVDTINLIQYSINNGKKVYLPRVSENKNLEFYEIKNIEDANIKSIFGIYEPKINLKNKLNKKELELIIVPGICFDKEKNRIGFGKGYYDKFLAGLNDVYKIGICFEDQILQKDIILTDKYDIKVNSIITEENIYN
jgi:5-formyltetrahydrofolate cyclo-ligase